MLAADTVLRDDRHRLMRRVVDDHQHPERPARRDTVKDEIHRPDLVGGSRTHERLPLTHSDLLPATTTHLQLLQRVKPLHSLVIEPLARLPKLQVDHLGAVAAMPLSQRNDLFA